MQNWVIRKLGGYPTIEDALADCPQQTLDRAVAHLFNVVSKDDILREDRGAIWYKGKTLNDQQIKAIKEEARVLEQLPLFKMLMAELRYKATRKIYFDSQSVEDLTWGKLVLFLEDSVKRRIAVLAKD